MQNKKTHPITVFRTCLARMVAWTILLPPKVQRHVAHKYGATRNLDFATSAAAGSIASGCTCPLGRGTNTPAPPQPARVSKSDDEARLVRTQWPKQALCRTIPYSIKQDNLKQTKHTASKRPPRGMLRYLFTGCHQTPAACEVQQHGCVARHEGAQDHPWQRRSQIANRARHAHFGQPKQWHKQHRENCRMHLLSEF